MTRVFENYQLIADGPGKIGQTGPQTTDAGTLLTPNSAAAPGGVPVGSHLIPSGYKQTLRTLALSAWHQSGVVGQSNAVGLHLGKVEILIGASVLLEFRSQDGMAYTTASGDEMVSEMYNAFQQFGLGDGIVVPAGTAFLVRVTPGLTIPIRWCVEAYSPNGNQVGIATTYTTTTNQTVLSYTSGADWTLQGLAFSSDTPGAVLGQMRLEYNGLPLFNTGDIGMDDSAPAPMDVDFDSVSGYGHGGLFLPLDGIELQQGERIDCLAHPWSAVGGKFQFTVFADQEAYSGGGGGGNTYSRGRVVNA